MYVVVEIRQLVNEISSFPEGLYKREDLKNFAKFTDKHLCPSLFINKAVGWKPEAVRSSHWRCSVKKVFLKRRTRVSEPAFP